MEDFDFTTLTIYVAYNMTLEAKVVSLSSSLPHFSNIKRNNS